MKPSTWERHYLFDSEPEIAVEVAAVAFAHGTVVGPNAWAFVDRANAFTQAQEDVLAKIANANTALRQKALADIRPRKR